MSTTCRSRAAAGGEDAAAGAWAGAAPGRGGGGGCGDVGTRCWSCGEQGRGTTAGHAKGGAMCVCWRMAVTATRCALIPAVARLGRAAGPAAWEQAAAAEAAAGVGGRAGAMCALRSTQRSRLAFAGRQATVPAAPEGPKSRGQHARAPAPPLPAQVIDSVAGTSAPSEECVMDRSAVSGMITLAMRRDIAGRVVCEQLCESSRLGRSQAAAQLSTPSTHRQLIHYHPYDTLNQILARRTRNAAHCLVTDRLHAMSSHAPYIMPGETVWFVRPQRHVCSEWSTATCLIESASHLRPPVAQMGRA